MKLSLSLALICAFSFSSIQAKNYAMVIGINKYTHQDSLRGAVNDARDINEALKQTGVQDIKMFLDHAATKRAIKARWDQMLQRSKKGDTLIVTYAGHGVQRDDHNHDESDGKDEVMALSAYNGRGESNRQNFIVDDEWDRWFAKAQGREIIFVVDACHSGTMDRSAILKPILSRRTFPSRIHHKAEAIDKEPAPSKQQLKHVLILAATTAYKDVEEMKIGGLYHGVLSWSFANGMRGEADFNDDRRISRQELSSYIRSSIKKMIPGQTPEFLPTGAFRSPKPIFTSAGIAQAKKKELTIGLARNGDNHVIFSTVENQYPYLTLFNITQNGAVQFLYPQSSIETQRRINGEFQLKLKIDRTFTGNEKIVAIYSAQPQRQLHQLLTQLHNKPNGIRQLNAQKNHLLKGQYEEKSEKHYVKK